MPEIVTETVWRDTCPEITEFRIVLRPRPRWIPRRVWLRLIDLTTKPDYKVRRGRQLLTNQQVVSEFIMRRGDRRAVVELAIEKMAHELGEEVTTYLLASGVATLSVTLEQEPSARFRGELFHMTVWEYR